MGIEIERKFLVTSDDWRIMGEPIPYSQGYLVADGERTVRIRTAGQKGYITIKGRSEGFSRLEFEYEIPYVDALELFKLCTVPPLRKYRTRALYEGKIWEIDEFEADNKGLIMAEIELNSADETFLIPPWIGQEVTGYPQFYNSYLVVRPFKSW